MFPALCRVVGSVVIVIGIYLVLWGKSKEKVGDLLPKAGCAGTVVKFDEQKIPTLDNNQVVHKSDKIMIPKAPTKSQESV